MRRVGLLGGSFNPAHEGHRAISLNCLRTLELDEIWWLVSPGNPLKPLEGMAALPARIESARRMARRSPIRVTALEREFGTRYTVDTLSRMVRTFPGHEFIWIMGEDNLAQFDQWKNWRRIAQTMPIAVINRPGYRSKARRGRAWAWLSRFLIHALPHAHNAADNKPALLMLRFPPDRHSATMLRKADPKWASRFKKLHSRDMVTRNPIY